MCLQHASNWRIVNKSTILDFDGQPLVRYKGSMLTELMTARSTC